MSSTILTTDRLTLRPFREDDGDAFLSLAGAWEVARMTSDIPHPLDREQAARWLEPAIGEMRFAIELEGHLIGGAGYFERTDTSVELGFWLGRSYWGHGYATEAARAVVAHGFETGRYTRFTSAHFIDNPASGRVIAKLGFKPTGRERMWSIARQAEVEIITFEFLLRDAVAQGLVTQPTQPRRWTSLFTRLAGNA